MTPSLERVWENVFDWEHLPWLHATTFRAIERLAEGRFDWRARVRFARGGDAEIELVADRTVGRYVDRYTRLWDEDEGMIRRRETALLRRRDPGKRGDAVLVEVSLGTETELRARFPVEFELGQERFALVEVDGALVARAAECPHRLGPLAPCPDAEDTLVCPWHGYRFDTNDGRELAGRKLRLARAPRLSRDSATGCITAQFSSRLSSPAEPSFRGVLARDEER